MTHPSEDRITYFARTNARGRRVPFGIKRKDRRYHMEIIGRTGTGKSTMLRTMIEQDIANGEGLAVLDPHGDMIESIVATYPDARKSDLIYWKVGKDTSISFNPLEHVVPEKRMPAASGLLDVFQKLWADSWGPRLEHILRNCFLALLEQEHVTLADIPPLLRDSRFRKELMANVRNRQVYDFWMKEYDGYGSRLQAEAIAPIQNKVGAFLANPILQKILDGSRPSLQLRQVMDQGKVLLVDLAKGRIGEDSAALLGGLLVAQIGHAAISRADFPPEERRDFVCYLDEFPILTSASLPNMLSELRKFGVSMVLAHQFASQVEEEVFDAILGNVGTLIAFRVGVKDAEVLAKEFFPEFTVEDLVNLPNHHLCLKLMIDGAVSRPFSAALSSATF